ncbi:MAG: histidine--tRNA ligase [Acidipila sp.]|nr:histidine--tRNA ligase [Acidipila sp.]
MAQQGKFQAIKGVRDILPPESALWNRVEQAARDVFATYGFAEIRLPAFEATQVFERSLGLNTDVVSKEMYTFEDHDLQFLEWLRAEVVARARTAASEKDKGALIARLNTFLIQTREQIKNGMMPQTAPNAIALTRLECDLNFFAAVSDRTPREEIESMAQNVRDTVEDIQFGVSVTLRPEATASVARAYIEHGMHTLPGDVKLYYMGPMFRRERPQKGRYRQFYQIGAEVLGQSDNPGIDAEVIEMLLAFLDLSGLTERKVYVNSIGCRECRPKYVELLRGELQKVKDQLGADSQRRIDTNPLRVLDSKLPEEQPLIETLPRIAEHLCEDCRKHYAALKEQLKLRGIVYEENWRLVRGLDYYMRTTFEITAPGLGSQNAVCGGGRYDGLVELLGGPPTKGIGFALGTDRLILALQEAGKGEAKPQLDVYVAWLGAAAYPMAVRVARTLRGAGFAVELPHEEMKFKKSLGLADRLGARYAVILGDDEVAASTCTVKRLADAHQEKIAEAALVEHLRRHSSELL